MFFTKTTTYALRLLIFMAADGKEDHNAAGLNRQLNIPLRYLSRLLTDLSKKGFISGSRGRKGGYVFSKSPEKIYLADIVDAVEGTEAFHTCVLGMENCTLQPSCAMHDMWKEARDKMKQVLSETSLADLKTRNPFGI